MDGVCRLDGDGNRDGISAATMANLRLSREVAIFPAIGYARIAEDEPNQIGKARFGADVIRQDDHASLAGLHADHGVGRLAVMATFVKAVALRAVENDNA